jgi:peptide/nickel transport system substrate-binding protein
MPAGPGATVIFAHLRRDWLAIGVEAERVGPAERADLRLVDDVAAAAMASWYLRHFTCDASLVCDPQADAAMEAARNARTYGERRQSLAEADRLLTDAVPFIVLAAPVRWSLVSPRLNGFRPNPSASTSSPG